MINFEALRKARERVDDSRDGQLGRCGNWKIALGGYDMGYEVYYKNYPVMRVNYELEEYEFYNSDYSDVMFTPDTVPQIKKALEITDRFDNVGDIDDNGDYIDHFGEYVNGVEANVSESGGSKMKFKKIVKEETILKMTDADYGVAGEICSELLNKIGVSDGASVLEVVANALKINPHGTEVNGDLVEDVTHDGLIHTFGSRKHKHYLLSDDVEWLRVEHYAKETKTPGPCIRYVYIHKKPNSDAFDMDNVQFDYYPDSETDDYVDGVQYRDCVRHMGASESTRRQNMKFKKIVKEARLPVMWAIDYRDFHTAIHGLIYGKNRRDVEKFYDRLKVIYSDDDISPEEQEMCYQDLWDEFYPRVQQIDEINFRDIGKLPSGKYGIVIDDVEYRLVNNVSIDIYEESTKRCSKMKSRKIVKEGSKSDFKSLDKAMWDVGRTPDGKRQNESDSDNSASDHPRIYVGTYAKYNDGSIDGKWIDISEYNTYEEFVDACRELHKDEKDPEFMVQDYENFPERWYHEAGLPTEEEFDKINEFYMMDDSRKDAYEAYLDLGIGSGDMEDFEERYQGEYQSEEDFAYNLVDDLGWDSIGKDSLDMYFDYDAFGRDLMYDFHMGDEDNKDVDGNPEDPDHYYDNEGYDMGEYESERQVAEDYIDNLGGVDQLGTDTARRYFDYEAFARDLFISDYTYYHGHVFSDY